MKKILLFAATATMLFAACTNEDLVAPQTGAETALEDGAVGFDVYLPGATAQTRAGRAGVMTTGVLQQTGFGIYGYQMSEKRTGAGTTADPFVFPTGYTSGQVPNYMWNQQVNFNKDAAGWYYAPLKYWPNETYNDSQTTPTVTAGMPDQTDRNYLDRVTFFAYAPWVQTEDDQKSTKVINDEIEAPEAVGITSITNNAGGLWVGSVYNSVADPKIAYTVATDPDYSVDLLWGVAPAGGLNYTAVNGKAVEVPEGMPLIDLVKPAVNTNIKFQFQHALARLGVKVVLAADQVAPGGKFDYGNTKVTIEKIEVKGNFGTKGILNLNNGTAKVANWLTGFKTDNLTIDASHGLAPHLVYDSSKNPASGAKSQQEVTGVTLNQADAIKVRSLYYAEYTDNCATAETGTSTNPLPYSPTRPYFASAANIATPTYATFNGFSKAANTTYLHKFETNNGVAYTNITGTINTTYPNATVWEDIYSITTGSIREVGNGVTLDVAKAKGCEAYRKVGNGNTYTATGQPVQTGDYVFSDGVNKVNPTVVPAPAYEGKYYKAMPNYFMVIPTQAMGDDDSDIDNRTLKVKITYYVSTTDASLKDGIVYTKNEVEKDVVLPHLKNGVAYDLRLILGLTSVKVEADVADWTTTGAEVNLPQNISE